MAKRTTKRSARSPSSSQLKDVLKRVGGSALSAQDKRVLSDMLSHNIKLRSLMERAAAAPGGRKVVASLPFGFDIVK
jgi:hypothetical protein